MRQLALEAEWIRAWRVAPDIVEAISKERADGALTLERLERPLPAS